MRLALILWSCLTASGLTAQEVYRSVDENGVVMFSDVATDDAQRMELPATVVRENAAAEQQALIEQQLEVAKALEESRLAREAARTDRLEALAAAQPRTIYYREADQTRYLGGSWSYWSDGYRPGHRPHPPWKPGPPLRPEPPIPDREPSRRVPLPPLKGN